MSGRFLIVSDVDGTLLGDKAALEAFRQWWEPRRSAVLLAYNSGRFARSLKQSIECEGLPRPDALIGGVGTEIFDADASHCWCDWPPPSTSWDIGRVRQVLADDDRLALQESEFQSLHKTSYYACGAGPADLDQWRQSLADAGLAVDLVYSSSRDLDVLPAGVNKGSAAAYLAQRWEIAPERVIVCGDTDNDLSMFQRGFRGAVVANALPELKALDGPHVYHCQRAHAAGVLEGVAHWMSRS
ncbi:MAG TPA: HAD-IIB family hydrolase [Lacipirellulaceae bacterium]|nr:HAD-IIB family hydrolase [Lacipirellulaceae bacterium]